MPSYPSTRLDRATQKAIDEENAAVLEEQRTGRYVDTEGRRWFRELLAEPEEEKS
jgi:hypothetical protein